MNHKSMRLSISMSLVLVFCLCLASWAEDYNYEISEYTATFDLSDKTSDVNVTLEIVYAIGDTYKVDGFKFVGKNEVAGLTCIDDTGEELQVRVLPMKETKIEWRFQPVRNCSKKITARFKLKNLLKSSQSKTILKVEWVGVFRVPVHKSTFVVMLPDNLGPKDLITHAGVWNSERRDGRWIIEMDQDPLKKKDLVVEFREKNWRWFIQWLIVGVSAGIILLIWAMEGRRASSKKHRDRSSSTDGYVDTGYAGGYGGYVGSGFGGGGGCAGGGCGGGGCGG